MYKDKDKQREANRKAKQKQRQGMTKGMTSEGMTHKEVMGMTEEIKQIEKDLVDMGITPKSAKPELTERGNIRVSKPGDNDYVPMCETTRATVPVSDQPKKVYPLSIYKPEGRPKFIPGHLADLTNDIAAANPKRGKDIKTFADLPPDVQATINRISQSNEEKQKRTKAAIKYQHLFPDRFHSTGIAQTAEKES